MLKFVNVPMQTHNLFVSILEDKHIRSKEEVED